MNFVENQETVIIDLPTKKGNVIKLAGTTSDPYFCGKDVCAILEYENPKQALLINVDLEDKKPLKDLLKRGETTIGKIYENEISYNEGKAVYVSLNGLKIFLQRTRNGSPEAKRIISETLGLAMNIVLICKEQSTVSDILRAFPTVEYKKQFTVGSYRVDLYFPEYKIAIECDEYGHRNRDGEQEASRQKFIEETLSCRFVRYDPDSKDFNVLDVVGKINSIILGEKDPLSRIMKGMKLN